MPALAGLIDILFDAEPHTYRVGGRELASVTQVICAAGAGQDFGAVPPERMEYARERGRLVHLACHYYNDGDLDMATIDPVIRGYVEGYILFREECTVKVSAVEERLAWPEIGLAGTPDLVGFVNGRRAIVDYKTGQTLHPSAAWQTAGYKVLWEAAHPNQGIYARFGLHLKKNGKYKLTEFEDPKDVAAFEVFRRYAAVKQEKNRMLAAYGLPVAA